MDPPPSVFSNRERKSPQRGLGRPLERWRYQCNFPAPHEPQISAMCCVILNQIDPTYMICVRSFVVLFPHYSTLSSPLPFRCDKISGKGQVFRSLVWSGFIRKAVWGVVKSWEFEGNLRCSKILRIRRKNPVKWAVSISRDYWVYLLRLLDKVLRSDNYEENSEKSRLFTTANLVLRLA